MSISFSPSVASAATNAIYITIAPQGQHPKDVVGAAWAVRNRFDSFAKLFAEYRLHPEEIELSRVRDLHREVVKAVRVLEKSLGLFPSYEGPSL